MVLIAIIAVCGISGTPPFNFAHQTTLHDEIYFDNMSRSARRYRPCDATLGVPIDGGKGGMFILGNPTLAGGYVKIFTKNGTNFLAGKLPESDAGEINLNTTLALQGKYGAIKTVRLSEYCDHEVGQIVSISDNGNVFVFTCWQNVIPFPAQKVFAATLVGQTYQFSELTGDKAAVFLKYDISLSGNGNLLVITQLHGIGVIIAGGVSDANCSSDDTGRWNGNCKKYRGIGHANDSAVYWHHRQGDEFHANNFPHLSGDASVSADEQFGYALSADDTGEYVAVASRPFTDCEVDLQEVPSNAGQHGAIRVFKRRQGGEGWFYGAGLDISSDPVVLSPNDTFAQFVFSKRIYNTSGMGLNVALVSHGASVFVSFAVYDAIDTGALYVCDVLVGSCSVNYGNRGGQLGSSMNGIAMAHNGADVVVLVGAPSRGVVYGFRGKDAAHLSTVVSDGYGVAAINTDQTRRGFWFAVSHGRDIKIIQGLNPTPTPPPTSTDEEEDRFPGWAIGLILMLVCCCAGAAFLCIRRRRDK